MNRRAFLRSSSVIGAAGLAGCPIGGSSGPAAGDTPTEGSMDTPTEGSMDTPTEGGMDGGEQVDMSGNSFVPKKVEVSPGTTVQWTNRDSYGHDVVSAQFTDAAASWDFQSETLGAGGSTSFTFDSEGVYQYFCSIHRQSTMCGVVLVGDASMSGTLPCSSDDGGYGGGY